MKKKIVIGSVLKPVNDARMYEKIAISLGQLPDLEIHVAGFQVYDPDSPENIRLHPLFNFPRLSISRLLAPWKFYKLLIKVKPDIVIITTHDLLLVTILYKILFGARIIYDVQENYFRNILYGNGFSSLVKPLLAGWVRLKEWLTRPFISHYFLAERNYESEFSFTTGKSTILENKGHKPNPIKPRALNSGEEIRLLYSGTIAGSYGIFEAIKLAKALHQAEPRITLTIIGYASIKEILKRVCSEIETYPFITLIGGDQLVPHKDIIREIKSSHLGLLPYPPNKSTDNCIPTKLYEYLAYRLPMLIRDNPVWNEFIEKYQAGISLNYQNYHVQNLLQEIKTKSFYTQIPDEDIYWESEEKKLLNVINGLLSSCH